MRSCAGFGPGTIYRLGRAGASGENRIATNVGAFIVGEGVTGINADSVTLQAHDASRIKADVVGASLAIGLGGVVLLVLDRLAETDRAWRKAPILKPEEIPPMWIQSA